MTGERLKEERKRLGYSQEDFAVLAGITRRPYAEWEAGNTSPNATQLAALAAAGADVQYIVTGQHSDMALTPDERQLLSLFRAASLTGKMAAVGALQGAMGSTPVQPSDGGATQNFHAPVRGGVAGRDIVNKGRK